MGVTMKNGTAPYKFQAIVADVRAHDWSVRFHTHLHSSGDQKPRTGHQVKWFVDRVAVWTGTNLSLLVICCRPKRQREILSYVTYFTNELRLGPPIVVMTDANGNAAVSGVYAVGAGVTNSCVKTASTLTVGMENMYTYSVSLEFRVRCTEHSVICRHP